jgi:antirestriction protein
MTEEEIRERYGDAPNIHVTCEKCRAEFEARMADACPEWDETCKMEKKGKG